MKSSHRSWTILAVIILTMGALIFASAFVAAAQQTQKQSAADGKFRLDITENPSADCGGPEKSESIAGKVSGVAPKQYRLVIYSHACNGVLYVQPTIAAPFVSLDSEGKFDAYIHLGQTYFLVLVEPGFKPKAEMTETPEKGGGIVAVFKVPGKKK